MQQGRPDLARGLVGEPGRVQHLQHVRPFVIGQFSRVMERLARAFPARDGVPLPVHRGAGFTQHLARPAGAYCLLHGREMLVDDLAHFSPESALFDMASNTANAFPSISSAARVFPSSPASLSFPPFSFFFSAPTPA